MLSDAVKQILHDPTNNLQHRIADIKQKIEVEKGAYLQGKNVSDVRKRIIKLKNKVAETKVQLDKQKSKITEIKRVQKLWSETQQKVFHIAEKIMSSRSQSSPTEHLKKEWIIYAQFVLPALQALINDLAETKELQGIKTHLDQELLDQVISEKIA